MPQGSSGQALLDRFARSRSMRRRAALVAAVLGPALVVGSRPPPAAPAPDLGGGLIGHRAGLARAPENSLAAIDRAAADGANAVELDVRRGEGGVPVCAH